MPIPNMTNRRSSAAPGIALAAMFALVLAIGLQSQAFAASADAGKSTWAREREIAAHDLELAHRAAEQARATAAAAKVQLDDFIARHFDDQRLRGAAPLPRFRESQPAREHSVNPRWKELTRQLADLKTHREDLLNRLMPAHPDVLKLDDHIAELSQQLALERPIAEERAPTGPAEGDGSANASIDGYLSLEQQRQQQTAATYEEIFARWQTAERDLLAGLEAERAAARHLAEIKVPAAAAAVAHRPVPTPLPKPSAGAPRPTINTQDQGSQPLALAVLLTALAVAALVAVRLARSSNDAVFASAADVSAALALPVVGIIPAAERPVHDRSSTTQIRRCIVLVAQVLLALLVFAAVAYLVQNLSLLWQLCMDPLEALSRMSRFFATNHEV